ncbi:MAG: PH domain-containing protein [Acidimicrobiales bacterium]
MRAGRGLIPLVVVLVPTLVSGGTGNQTRSLVDLGVLVLLLVLGVISWLVTRWQVSEGTLRIETGLLRRQSLRFPLTQIQAIDVVRPALARVAGLSELRLRMAGSGAGAGRLAYLTRGEAEELRGRLLALAHGIAEDTPPPPGRTLVSVPAGRLVTSIALSKLGLVAGGIVVVLFVIAAVLPAALPGIVGASAAGLLGLATALWRRLNGNWRLSVAEAPDGFRLTSGLLETTTETIPRGRVQAVRMVEPLLWRPLGWCRLEVDVAGRQRKRGENQAESHALRSVLPVGSVDDARWLLTRILPGAPQAGSGSGRWWIAPRRARWKSPLRYRNLSWIRTDTCAGATSGRLARTTAWVPLDKVQSLRRVQGPVQRRLGLVTLHLDSAGRSVHAALRDRDAKEGSAALEELTTLCRAERSRARDAASAPRGA